MAIKLGDQKLYTLTQAAKKFLPKKNGRFVSRPTVWRWMKEGVRMPDGSRVKLQVWHCGGTTYTTAEACREFIEQQTQGKQAPPSPDWPRRDDVTERQLRDAGLM